MTGQRTCYKCGRGDVRTYATFGKYICKECLEKRKTGRKGHSGMIYDESVDPVDYYRDDLSDDHLELVMVKKSNPLFVKWFIEHYPQSKGIVGRQVNYLIYSYGEPVGIIGFASPPLNYGVFNEYFDLPSENPSEEAKSFMSNNIYRLVKSFPNFATQVLSTARRDLQEKHVMKYGHRLDGIVTFVEPPLDGAIYRADNWDYLGMTQGVEVKRRGEEWTDKQYVEGSRKHIYGYKYPDRRMRSVSRQD